jgi:transposase-like protein
MGRDSSPAFKAQVVLRLLSGQRFSAEPCREHQLRPSLLASWNDTVLGGLPTLFPGDDQRSQEHTRVAELEQLVGRQTLELKILKKASRLRPGTADKSGRLS